MRFSALEKSAVRLPDISLHKSHQNSFPVALQLSHISCHTDRAIPLSACAQGIDCALATAQQAVCFVIYLYSGRTDTLRDSFYRC